MHQNISNAKWEATFSRKLEKSRADQIWPLFEDFIGLNKWFTVVPTSYGIHGTNGEPGCVRYCTGSNLKLPGHQSNPETVSWSKERLLAIDGVGMTLTYEVTESNTGFNSYVATFKVVPGRNGESDAVEWCVSVEPLDGISFDDFVSIYESWLKLILDNMEITISQSSGN